jgi:diguanylate cyclase (GGDEF)-like protein
MAPAGERPLVLVVDDDAGARLIARASLERAGMAVEEASNGREGVAAFERLGPDLTLLDILMPEMDGFAACAAIRSLPGGKLAPVLMMTGLEDAASIQKAFEVGATDFTTKPIDAALLGHRAAFLVRAGRAFDTLQEAEASNRALLEALGRKNAELQHLNENLWNQATHDGLTGLYNHRFLQEALIHELARADRLKKPLSIVMVDVDAFKRFNDVHGHQAGDAVLRRIGELLLGRVRKSDLVARYGGEEFVVLLPEADAENGLKIAEALRKNIAAHPFPGRETQPHQILTASFGLSVYPEAGSTPAQLIQLADQAMYQAKRAGGNCVRLAAPLSAGASP